MKVKNQIITELVEKFNASGRTAFIHPRKKTVSLSGFPPISYKAAIQKIRSILAKDISNN